MKKRAKRFVVTRTSSWLHWDRPPCDGAELIDANRGLWTVEFTSLDELMEFVDKYGSIIISPRWDNEIWTKTGFVQPSYPTIEICDDWRE